MTPEQINKAIDQIVNQTPLVGLKKRGYWYRPNAAGYTDRVSEAGRYTQAEAKKLEYHHGDEPVTIQELPPLDYHGDLNACHQFEKTFTTEQCYTFDGWLYVIQNRGPSCPTTGDQGASAWRFHATAPQRCEAFLQTFGKWVQS